MSYNWGPRYIVPSETFKTYSGSILLREEYDDDLLHKELEELGFADRIVRVTNPWYYRRKNTNTWIKIGESEDRRENFSVRWDTTTVENGTYEIMGLMHVFIDKDVKGKAIVGENIVEVTVEN